MKKIKLLYFSTDNIGRVVEGQVYKLLEHYQSCDVFSEIVLLQPYSNNSILENAKKVLGKYSFRIIYYYCRPLAPNKYSVTIKNLRGILEKEMTPNAVIHTRNNILAPFIRKALPPHYKDAYILAEFRGLTVDELKVAHPKRVIDYIMAYCIKVPYARLLLRKLYKDEHSFITVVSPLFKQLILQKDVSDKRISVHPNIVSADFIFNNLDREEIRKRYGIPNEKPVAVLSSSGGSVWQNDSATIDRLIELGYVVFNLGRNRIEREGVINEYLTRSEMPKYLSAADVAVLWREDIPLNNVACPSKFGEFLIMGLYVIHNGTVDIARRCIEGFDAGLIVRSPSEISIDVEKLSMENRRHRSELGYTKFSVENVAKSYISHYTNKN